MTAPVLTMSWFRHHAHTVSTQLDEFNRAVRKVRNAEYALLQFTKAFKAFRDIKDEPGEYNALFGHGAAQYFENLDNRYLVTVNSQSEGSRSRHFLRIWYDVPYALIELAFGHHFEHRERGVLCEVTASRESQLVPFLEVLEPLMAFRNKVTIKDLKGNPVTTEFGAKQSKDGNLLILIPVHLGMSDR